MRRVISRPPTRPATSALAPLVGWLPHPARTSTLDTTDGSRSCQPQLSFIVPTIYGSVYTSADTRYRPWASPTFQRFISARSLVYPRRRQRSTHRWYLLTACHLLPRPRISGCVARLPFLLLRSPHRTPSFARYATSPPCTMFSSFFFPVASLPIATTSYNK